MRLTDQVARAQSPAVQARAGQSQPSVVRWLPPGSLLLWAVILLATASRIYLLATTDFPINDGALFTVFTESVGRTFPGLPTWIDFNGLHLPFGYPPLAFWLAAAATRLGLSTLSIVHVAPVVMNIVYLLLYAAVLLRRGCSSLFTAVALFIFATSFRSFEWLVMGGGLSRGLGGIFALLLILALSRPSSTREPPQWKELLAAGVAVAGAMLSHLEWGLLSAATALLLLGLRAESPRGFVRQSFVLGLTAIALVLPWASFVYMKHGLAPFIAASSTSDWYNGWKLEPLWRAYWIFTGQAGATLPFVVIGAVSLLLERRPFWIGFFLLSVFVTPRHGPTPAVLALSVLAAAGAVSFAGIAERVFRSRVLAIGVTSLAVLLAVGARNNWSTRPSPYFEPLSPAVRSAMAWVTGHGLGNTFAVVTCPEWQYDASAEWFPYLTHARSVTTVQGLEWAPPGTFKRTVDGSAAMKGSTSCRALTNSLRYFSSDYIWTEVRPDCFSAAGFPTVFANGAVTIFRGGSQGHSAAPPKQTWVKPHPTLCHPVLPD
jgi:hypothetical protein